MILNPEWWFSGLTWHSGRHRVAIDTTCLNIIQLDVEPSIDYSPKTAAERPQRRRGHAQQPAQRGNKYIY